MTTNKTAQGEIQIAENTPLTQIMKDTFLTISNLLN